MLKNKLLSDILNKKNYDFYIKDPIHKEINFSSEPWIAEFAFSNELIRLKDIKQLGVSFKTFNSATHNRYAHSLGTYQVAQKFVSHFKNQISTQDKKIFLISAMLHDIGHGPFSHIFEKISGINHEDITREIILSKELSINEKIKKNDINPDSIVDVYLGCSKKEWISKLISSNLDVDRIDYLLRDSYHIGTYYATIDIDFLIERCILLDTDICFFQSANNYIESFLLGRYYMHLDIYDNKNGYVYEWSLKNVFERLKEIKEEFYKHRNKIYYYDFYEWLVFGKKMNILNFIKMNDLNITSFIDSLKILNDDILNTFIENFVYSKRNIIAINWSKDNFNLLNEISLKSKYDPKYLFKIVEKNKKDIYYEGEKNVINIYNNVTKKIEKFSANRLIEFNKKNKNLNNKIILVNKTLIN